jgi:hypothetical protein
VPLVPEVEPVPDVVPVLLPVPVVPVVPVVPEVDPDVPVVPVVLVEEGVVVVVSVEVPVPMSVLPRVASRLHPARPRATIESAVTPVSFSWLIFMLILSATMGLECVRRSPVAALLRRGPSKAVSSRASDLR